MKSICENCDEVADPIYQVRRYRRLVIGSGNIFVITFSFTPFKKKHLENVCINCLPESVELFTDSKHSVEIHLPKRFD